jgi:hypothetical protein
MKLHIPCALALTLAIPLQAFAQTTVERTTETTTTSTLGTVSEFGPERITVRTETSTEPLSYAVSKTVTYVDETGAPVSMETVKSGLPVTVHYTRDGEALVAKKIVVRKRTTTVPGAETTTTTTTSMGTISEFEPDRLVIRTTKTAAPLRYKYTKTTQYVDEAGRAVSLKTVKSGLPVTVHYTKVGNDLVANRVIVRKVTTTEEVPAADIQTEVRTISGTVNEFGKGSLVIRTPDSVTPLIYTANGTTMTVDATGQPVGVEMIRSGLPVTVHYTTDGDERIVTKIVLTKQKTTVPPRP